MSNQSIVERRANYYYIEFREELLIIALNCEYKKPGTAKTKCKASPYCKSLILAILEGWTNDKRGRGSDLSVYMTYPQWIDAMYGMFGRSVIIDSLDELIGEGLISRQPHRMYDRDTYKYLLNYRELNNRLRALPERDPNEKHPQVNWQKPKNDPSTNRRVGSTSISDTRLLVDGNPSTSRRNIESTKKHNTTSNKERVASVSKTDAVVTSPPVKNPDIVLMDTWDDICGEPIPRDRKHKEAAAELARCGATREDLINNRDFCLRTNPQWYKKNGVDLAAIARNWGKWKSSLSQSPQQQQQQTTTSAINPNSNKHLGKYFTEEQITEMDEEELAKMGVN